MSEKAPLSELDVVRRGTVSWLTHPPSGEARIEADSFAFHAMPVSMPDGDPLSQVATPGELLAVTHAIFLAAALSEALALGNSPANEIVVSAACTFRGRVQDRGLAAVDLRVRGRVPGLDPAEFREAVAAARQTSLRAAGLREDIPGSLEAELAPSN